MKLFLGCIFAILSFSVASAERSDGFWDKCPGPACPSHLPGKALDTRAESLEQKERDLSRREDELFEREKQMRQQIQRANPPAHGTRRDKAAPHP